LNVSSTRSDGIFDSILGCMNTRLAPAYMVNVLGKWVAKLSEMVPKPGDAMFRAWVTDSIAVGHSDMVYLSREAEPELWLYAPMQSRPLGKSLPSILATCSCPGFSAGETSQRRRAGGRKTWDVRHTNGKDGTLLREVSVTASCLICKQSWPLPSEHMVGVLRKHYGVFSAIVPYFSEGYDDAFEG
jgi:hypothetical protein